MEYIKSLMPQIPPPTLSYFHPLPFTTPLTPIAAAAPPVLYYIALLLLPPPKSSSRLSSLIAPVRTAIAITAAALFLRLPLAYHVPFSVGLTYQLALVGLYGSGRIIDTFFISANIPRRVTYHHAPRHDATPADHPAGPAAESYFSLHFLQPATGKPVIETATSDKGLPTDFVDRASWALELMLAMRGAGFTWTSADVRHTRRTWSPTPRDRLHSIIVHAAPVLLLSWAIIHDIWTHYLASSATYPDFASLPFPIGPILTASLGAFLMSAFSIGHSAFAILLAPLAPHPLAYFPPLYTARVWEITSVRSFWSYAWHRLFSRLFLVYGSRPGEHIERFLTGKSPDQPADTGKVLGAFASSAVVHSFASFTVVYGTPGIGIAGALGEGWFFMGNAVAVLVEEGVKRVVLARRRADKKSTANRASDTDGDVKSKESMSRWYDGVVARIWWMAVLLYTGRNFASGWVRAGLVREMAFA